MLCMPNLYDDASLHVYGWIAYFIFIVCKNEARRGEYFRAIEEYYFLLIN